MTAPTARNPVHARPVAGGALRRAASVATLAGILFIGGAANPVTVSAQPAPIRVMSFNIRYGTANDGAHAWSARRAAVIGTIRDHAPHLLGLQEALRFQLDEIGAALAGHREIGVGRDDGRTAGEYAAILVDTGRFTVIAHGTFWLSDTPDVPGSMHWGNRITRITTWARLVDRALGDTVRVYNAHWDHESQPSRERSAALMLRRMASDGAPSDRILVMGDFNAGESNPAFRALLSDARVPLVDVHRWFGPDEEWGGTFHGFAGGTSGEKIDAILMRRGDWVLAGDAGVDRRRWGALWASDHYAVWALLSPVVRD